MSGRAAGFTLAAALLGLTIGTAESALAESAEQLPVIDVHRHAPRIGADDEAARQRTLESMRKNGIVRSVLYLNEPSDVETWIVASPGMFVGSVAVPCWRNRDQSYYCFPSGGGWPDLAWLERELSAGRVSALGEMLFNYAGISPTDPRIWPYWALAAKYDVPVFVHTGRGPGPGQGPREDDGCCVAYNENFGDPELLRPVLEHYPKLRVALLHFGAGSPPDHLYFREEALALMRDYPGVYVDLTILSSLAPAEVYAGELRWLINAGFADRIMFGTDNLPPEPILQRLAAMDWLTEPQRRNILYGNAARFLRLGPAGSGAERGK